MPQPAMTGLMTRRLTGETTPNRRDLQPNGTKQPPQSQPLSHLGPTVVITAWTPATESHTVIARV